MNKNDLRKLIKEVFDEITTEEKPLNELSLKTMTLNQFLDNGLTEADMLGATTREVPDKEMQDYLTRVRGEPAFYKKTGLPKLNKKGKQKYVSTKEPVDKYKMPYVHTDNIEIKDENDRTYDLEKLKLSIKVRPTTLLKQNEKITHSGGDATVYFNLGLPALKGLAVNEKNNEFVIVDTCPGAGACKVYCYAKKGGYVQWKASSMSQTRVLNFLLNDPEGFKSKLSSEIKSAQMNFNKKQTKLSSNKNKTKLVIRWHDAGDFFSPEYLNLAYSIASNFPDVDFYAYTKMASVAVGTKPANFTTNFLNRPIVYQSKSHKNHPRNRGESSRRIYRRRV